MATRETVYEAIVKLRAESAQLRADLASAQRVLEGSLRGMGGIAKALAPTLSVAGVVAFGKSVLDTAGQLTDLSAQTQISAQFLSGIKSTLEENGTALETFAKGVFIAQKNLGGIDDDSDQAAQALKRIGLSVEELQAATPERFIELVGKALDGIASPAERAAIGAKIFGKSWQEVGPVLSDIANRMEELRASGMSEADIAALDSFGDTITRLANRAKIAAAGPLADFAAGIERIFNLTPQAKLINQLAAVNDEIDRIDKTLETRRSTSALLAQFLNPFESIQFGTTEELIARRKELFEINKKLGAQQAELNAQKPRAVGADTSAVAAKAAAEAAKAQAKAAEDLVAITRELDQAAMTPLGKTIDEIRVKYAGFATTGATAFKGQAAQLDAFNAKLDATRDKLITLAKQQAGQTAVQKFEQQFEVKFEFTNKAAGLELAQNFATVFNQFKNDRNAQTQFNQAFASLVRQAVAMGLPDIPELLQSAGLSGADISRLAAQLPTDLLQGFDNSRKAGEQWGKTLAAETAAVGAKFEAIATALDTAKQKTDELVAVAAQQLSLSLDTSRAVDGLEAVKRWLDAIPDISYKSIVFTTYGTASPRKPFSEFAANLQSTLGDLTQDRRADIVYNVGQSATRDGRAENLAANVGATATGATTPVNPAFDGAAGQAKSLRLEIASIRSMIREINANPIRPIS